MRLGVLGWPVAHSRSPAMHTAALTAAGLEGWTYQLLPVPPEAFADTVRALPAAGFRGANVTIPHTEAALALADRATERAREIGAANTLAFGSDGIEADNTDAPGLLAALGAPPASALVLGAGGAARAAVWALRGADARVAVLNRTRTRAENLVEDLGGAVVDDWEEAELLVNATSVGLRGEPFTSFGVEVDALHLFRRVVDLVYRPDGTALVTHARERGLVTVDGHEVLARQGALSFERWIGRPAPLEAMRRAI